MRQVWQVVVGGLLVLGVSFFGLQARGDRAQADEVATLFEFERMVGVTGSFLGPTKLRDIAGGGLPWVIAEGEAKLDEDGTLTVKVEGLVLDPNDDRVPASRRGINPIAKFFATVSCLDLQTGSVVNTDTATADATAEGDARIMAKITLPASCVAPVVLVRGDAGPGGQPNGPDANDPWFAVSGF